MVGLMKVAARALMLIVIAASLALAGQEPPKQVRFAAPDLPQN